MLLKMLYLCDHWVRVDLTHVLTGVFLLHVFDRQSPEIKFKVDSLHLILDLYQFRHEARVTFCRSFSRAVARETYHQCDQIGRFLKFLATKFQSKEAQIIGNLLGYFEKPHSYVKTALATFWATVGKNLATFISNIWLHCLQMLFLQFTN